MKRALLLLLLAGCMEAQAGPSHGPGVGARMLPRLAGGGGGGGEADAGNIIDNYAYDFAVEGYDCPGVDGGVQPWNLRGDGGALAWGFGADASQHLCNQTTTAAGGDAAVGAGGIGSDRVNRGVLLVETGSNCWTSASTTIPGLADGVDLWIRAIVRQADNTANRNIIGWGQGASDRHTLQSRSTEAVNYISVTDGLATYTAISSVLPTTGYSLLDIYYDAAGPTNPRVDFCVNGTCATGTEHTADFTELSAGTAFAIGGDRACTVASVAPDIEILSISYHLGANAAQFTGEAMHDSDWNRMVGVAP